MSETDTSTAFVAQDLAQVQTNLNGISLSADKVSKSLTNAFSGAVVAGKSFDQTLQTILLSLSKMALNAGLQPLTQGLTSGIGSLVSGLTGSLSGGASLGATAIAPFAEGGIVAQPTFFGSNGGLGLMGERGAEAIVPLSRGPDGRLGLASQASANPVTVNVSIATPDADSFRRSQVQVSSALARAVSRGQRGL